MERKWYDEKMIPSFSSFSPLAVTGSFVWVFFAFVVFVWVTATLVLEYHWKNYTVDGEKITSARFLYRTGSFFLLTIILLAAISYSLS